MVSNKPKLIFSTSSYEYLLDEVAQTNEFEKGALEIKFFPDGERYQRILSDVLSRDVVVIGGTISDEATLELYDLAYALIKYGGTVYHHRDAILWLLYHGASSQKWRNRNCQVTRRHVLSFAPNELRQSLCFL